MMLRLSVECWDILMLYIPEEVLVEYMDLVPGIVLHIPLDVLEQKAVSIIAPFTIPIIQQVQLQQLYVQVHKFIN